jgi:hypothetical protein
MTSTLAPDCRLLQEYKSMVEQKGLFTSNVEMVNPFRWGEGTVTRVERYIYLYISTRKPTTARQTNNK